jgi:hypothetical protein
MKKNKIEMVMAATIKVDQYTKEIKKILKILGHPDALVSDESTIWDFLSHFGNKKENKKENKKILEKISCILALDIKESDFLIDIAKRIRNQ